MPKTKTQPIPQAVPNEPIREKHRAPDNEPLSGSKKVKNRNHSRQNHGDGM